jgi:hypothetical protein
MQLRGLCADTPSRCATPITRSQRAIWISPRAGRKRYDLSDETRNKGFRVNRIKMIKRQMYGRADFSLLRKRVLLAT